MEFSRIYRQGAVLFGSAILMLAFQNCGKPPATADSASTASSGVTVLGATSGFSKVTYDPNLEGRTGAPVQHLEIDIEAGTVSSGSKTCQLDVDREQKLKQLLSAGRVCKAEAAAGMESCMAYSMADIKLEDLTAGEHVLLRAEICNHGTFLCDGDDAILRGLVKDLIDNPVTDCQ